MRRRPLFWVLFVILQTAVVLLAVEVLVRIARPRHELMRALLYSPTVGTEYDSIATTEELLDTSVLRFSPRRLRQGYVLNSRGFRSPELSSEGGPGAERVAVFGDSFTFASGGVSWGRMWHTRMAGAINRDPGRRVEVVNLGVPAVGPRFELRLWELERFRLQPDLVILAFFVGNDFADESGTPLRETAQDRLAFGSLTYRLLRNLRRLSLERETRGGWPALPPEDSPRPKGGYEDSTGLELYDPMKPTFSEERFLEIEWGRMAICRRDFRSKFESLFAETTPILRRFHYSVRETGSRFAVVLIPDEYQVSDELFGELLDRFPYPAEKIDRTLPQHLLGEFLRAEGIPYLDLLPVFRERGREARLYRLRDTHWNVEGNALAGELVADFLVANRLLGGGES